MWLLEILPVLTGIGLPTLTLAGAVTLAYTTASLWAEGPSLPSLCLWLMGLGELLGAASLWQFRRSKAGEKTRRTLKQTAKLGGVLLGSGFALTLATAALGAEAHPTLCWALLLLVAAICAFAAWLLLRPKRPPQTKRSLTAGQQKALEQLEALREAGLLTHEEYQQKRAEILKGL